MPNRCIRYAIDAVILITNTANNLVPTVRINEEESGYGIERRCCDLRRIYKREGLEVEFAK
jgi:hypothetical protein